MTLPIINCAGPSANLAGNTRRKSPTSFPNTPNTTAGANRICSIRTRSASSIIARPNVFPQRGTTSWTRRESCIEMLPQDQRTPITNWCCIRPWPAEIWSIFTSPPDATRSLPNKAAPAPMPRRRSCGSLFKKDQDFSDYYNNVLAGGKWHHMMDQPHIGYTSWAPPRTESSCPGSPNLPLPDTDDFGVAVDGSAEAWPGGGGEPTLPPFDSLNPQRSYIDVFARGSRPIEFKATADQPWIRSQRRQGTWCRR